jgi:hypothetical protein
VTDVTDNSGKLSKSYSTTIISRQDTSQTGYLINQRNSLKPKFCRVRDLFTNEIIEADTIEEFTTCTSFAEFSFYSGAIVSGASDQAKPTGILNSNGAQVLRSERRQCANAVYKLLVGDLTVISVEWSRKEFSNQEIVKGINQRKPGSSSSTSVEKQKIQILKENKQKRLKAYEELKNFAILAGLADSGDESVDASNQADATTAFLFGLIIMDLGKVESYANHVTVNSNATLSASYLQILGAATEMSMDLQTDDDVHYEAELQTSGKQYGKNNVHAARYKAHDFSGVTASPLPSFGDLKTRWKCQLRAMFMTEFLILQFVQCELSPASMLPLECWIINNPHKENTDKLLNFFLLLQVLIQANVEIPF